LSRYDFSTGGPEGRQVELGVRPEHVVLGPAAKDMPVTAEVEVEIVEPMGSDTLVWTRYGGQSLTVRAETDKVPAPGDRVLVGFDPGRASIFDAADGERL
jgi:multiple sugar transport system ATP-binding protein